MPDQLPLFDPAPALPEGFEYQADVISRDEEERLLADVRGLPFEGFEFHGFTGKRRVVSFGWRYDFSDRTLLEATEVPPFLLRLRDAAARFAELPAGTLKQVLVTEYDRAAIGWHRDKHVFGDVVGVSLLSACAFRLRRKVGDTYERVSLIAEPRSAYLLRGPARTQWEHSIPETEGLRYSVTFRTVR